MSSKLATVPAVDDRHGCIHVPPRHRGRFVDSVDTSVGTAVAFALTAVERMVGGALTGLGLFGPPGCGKSLLAAVACAEIGEPLFQRWGDAFNRHEDFVAEAEKPIERRADWFTYDQLNHWGKEDRYLDRVLERRCPRWISVPSLLVALRREMRSETRPETDRLEEIRASDGLLVLDDLGAEKASDWTIETLFELVADRYDRDIPVIVTSNKRASELSRMGYDRIVSRLADEGELLELATARDYRRRRKAATT